MSAGETGDSRFTGLRGFLLEAGSPTRLRAVRDGAVILHRGRIHDAGEYERLRQLPEAKALQWAFGTGCVIVPGLIDLHAHIPQYPAVGRMEDGLLPWLERHIFPLERNFTPAEARRTAPRFFHDLAAAGTTQAVLYSSLHEESTEVCFEAARDSGLRAIIGKVMMDRGSYGSLPPGKILKTSMDETTRLIRRWHGVENGRLEYAVSPRFAVTCSREMMTAAGKLADEHGTWIQTHLSENLLEIKTVRELFPEEPAYTSVYASCGLTGPRSIFGHCLHLSDDELRLLADSGSLIAHCPTSNLFLRSGLFPLDRIDKAGIGFGIGSDVAAGPELNLWAVLRSALETQTARHLLLPPGECPPPPSPARWFYQATLGAARILRRESETGSLTPGKSADIVVIDLGALLPGGRTPNLDCDLSGADILSLLIHRCGPQATLETRVAGRVVYSKPQAGLFRELA